jgi:hypothetical protein
MPSFEVPPVGSKAAYLRKPGDPRFYPEGAKYHKDRSSKQFINTRNAKAVRYGYDPKDQAFAADKGLVIRYPNSNSFDEAREVFDILDQVDRESFGAQRPKNPNFDQDVPPGYQYENLSPMPIDTLGGRGGGKYADTGVPVPRNAADFAIADQYVQNPTTSEDVNRPRTVAAAYEPDEHKLTVVFRDNTYYNYYEVTKDEWKDFKESYSKGKYIADYLNSKPRGVADMSEVPAEILTHAFASSRLEQISRLTKPHSHKGVSQKVQTWSPAPKRRFSKSNGYKSPLKPRGVNAKKPVTPRTTSKTAAQIAAAQRAKGRRGLYGGN